MAAERDAKYTNLHIKHSIKASSVEAKKLVGDNVYAQDKFVGNTLVPCNSDTFTIEGNLLVHGRIIEEGNANVAVVLRGIQDPVGPAPSLVVEPGTWKVLQQWTSSSFAGLIHNPSFNEGAGVYTAPETGLYSVTLTLAWSNENTASNREIRMLDVDTKELLLYDQLQPTPNSALFTIQKLVGGVFLEKGQRVYFQTRQNSVSNAEIEYGIGSRLSIVRA